jgi:hypothetical protein
VVQRTACELLDKRKSARTTIAESRYARSCFLLIGVESHVFGRLKRRVDCEELAETMGLAIEKRLEYFGQAVIREA